jgi:Holliday junction resolvase-like predicted endonuclease
MPANYPPQVTEAIRLHREGQHQASRDCLCRFLLQQPAHIDALLWLARVTPDPQEALAAAELALKLDPQNDVAQRAVIAVRERAAQSPKRPLEKESLSATVALSTGMTLAQARAVRWPFRNINRPIGESLDDGTLTLRDLAFAVENAWDIWVRDAARTLLLFQLLAAEPQELPKPPVVIQGSRYTEYQERRYLLLSGLVGGALLALDAVYLIAIVASEILRRSYGWQLPIWWTCLFPVVFLLGLWVVSKIAFDRYADQADSYRLGRWGEEKAVEALRYALDGRWTIVRNLEFPNRRWGDVDLILIGPSGVWAFEVKAYSGQVRNTGDRWERRTKRRWRRLTTHPGHQARRNAARLKEYLGAHGVALKWVPPAVLWAGDSGRLIVNDPATPVWTLDTIADHADDLWAEHGLTEEMVGQVVDVLRQAVEAAKAEREKKSKDRS